MNVETVDLLIACIGLIYFAAALAWIIVALHMAYTKMDMMLDLYKNCKAIMARAPLRHGGPWGNLMLIGGISGIVTFPNFYLKRGELSLEDLKNTPTSLRRRLAILQWSVLGLLLVMSGFATIAIFELA
ncbi:hypothetical protein BJ917_2303 [Pseudomonas sp. WPR_5_2]|uniref:hypothetical protein n=1 Tax=Pseudomonas sp. WPR_5_2 TaxID=1907371 RepID=UPI000EAC656E|nr:hypothetical protein [Pseudomonas sp. WPR_5_2]RKS24822.1 hypothetical protein BJ917_2303 [Pseudomonas sp. WPR_5_2]